MRYRIAAGTRLELLDRTWAVFSPVSGETLQLNDEAAAILEVLSQGPLDATDVCNQLALDADTDPSVVAEAIHHTWEQLIQAGLIRSIAAAAHNSG